MADQSNNFYAELMAQFPWLSQIGLDPRWVQENAAEASGSAELLARMRATPQYKSRFPGLYRSDGSLRMNESEYLAREQDYRTLLRQFGYDPDQYSTPASLIGFFDSEMDPNEFQSRLQTYRDVTESSQAKKDAFYVYAGLDITDDDLYEAVVDPAAAQRLSNEYNQAVASQSLDYATWITRATEVANRRVADALRTAQANGLTTANAVQTVIGVDSAFARQIMDAIYTGGTGDTSQGNLSLEQLLSSFEYAAIGAAASEAGLELPTREQLAKIRQAGIERQQAIEAYAAYGQRKGQISAAVQRAGFDEFTQSEFEQSRFFGNQSLTDQMQRGMAQEEAAGRSGGSFRFSEDAGRLTQRGFGQR